MAACNAIDCTVALYARIVILIRAIGAPVMPTHGHNMGDGAITIPFKLASVTASETS